jgi:hypothetical protein
MTYPVFVSTLCFVCGVARLVRPRLSFAGFLIGVEFSLLADQKFPARPSREFIMQLAEN